MAIATTLREYLTSHHIEYELITHPRTYSSMKTAQEAHIPGDRLVKTVMLQDAEGFVMALLPATHKVELGTLYRDTERNFGLATEMEFAPLLQDCDHGAIPPVGEAYGIETIVDPALDALPDMYLEAGDHEHLVHLGREQFRKLTAGAERLHFTHHV